MNKIRKIWKILMENKDTVFKIIFSATFVLLAILMVFIDWFKNRIDFTIISLIMIAYLPWVVKYVKSLEAFGVKADLVTEEKKEEINKNIEKISPNITNINISNSNQNNVIDNTKLITFESISSINENNDTIQKLVLLRYQIENILKKLCKKEKIEPYKNIRDMSKKLYDKRVLKNYEVNLINDLLPVLNKAVHADLNQLYEVDWVIRNGITLLAQLETIYNK